LEILGAFCEIRPAEIATERDLEEKASTSFSEEKEAKRLFLIWFVGARRSRLNIAKVFAPLFSKSGFFR
jgi:hypothetical protein